jgi:hypothetical protein
MKNLNRKPTWELRNMVRALSMHSWLNTPAESQRLALAKHELDRRNKNGFVVGVNSND